MDFTLTLLEDLFSPLVQNTSILEEYVIYILRRSIRYFKESIFYRFPEVSNGQVCERK